MNNQKKTPQKLGRFLGLGKTVAAQATVYCSTYNRWGIRARQSSINFAIIVYKHAIAGRIRISLPSHGSRFRVNNLNTSTSKHGRGVRC